MPEREVILGYPGITNWFHQIEMEVWARGVALAGSLRSSGMKRHLLATPLLWRS